MRSSRECTVALAAAVVWALASIPAHADPVQGHVPPAHSCIVESDGRPRGLRAEGLVPRARAALADTNHLRVTFDSPSDPWTAGEATKLRSAVGNLLPVLEQVCGPPSGSDLIDVIKDRSLYDQGLAGTYSPVDHTIRLFQADTVTLCHELAHAFHGSDVVYWDGFEEGMAVAATAVVFQHLAHGKPIDHVGSTDDIEYELLNQPAISPHHGSFWAGLPGVGLRYDLAGYVWRKAEIEHPGFLRDFNRRYYERLAADNSVRSSVTTLVATAAEAAPTVEGEPFAAWADHQYVLGTTQALGVQIYVLPLAAGLVLFYRHADGYEEPLQYKDVGWRITDADEISGGSGTVLTDYAGLATLTPEIPVLSRGAMRIETWANTAYGSQAISVDRPVVYGKGIFGLVRGAREGSVTITPLDTALAPETVPVQWGQFEAPGFRDVAGRFELAYTDPDGRRVTRLVTKDAWSYLAVMDAPAGPLAPVPVSLLARPSIALAGCRFSLERPLSDPAHVTLYTVSGKILRVLTIPAVALAVDWDGQGQDGLFASAGVYIARVVAPGVEARTHVVVTH